MTIKAYLNKGTSKNQIFQGARKSLYALAAIIAVAGIAAIRLSCDGMPGTLPAAAPETEFSAERALIHVQTIAGKPRPSGSDAHQRARDYILARLTEAGWETRLQRTPAVRAMLPGYHTASSVENILARLRGTGAGEAVLFMGHYDSVPMGPGANDDGTAVAAMLESARALAKGPRPANDIILLFSDSEEGGLIGAHAFAENHPWRNDARLIVNFEARGIRGPSTLFETGPGNGGVLPGYFAAAPFATGNSLSNAIYGFLPNDTDFTVFKEAGYPGLNFAYIGGMTHYHTPLDSFENVEPRSLQHHGSHLMALARHFGNAPLGDLKKGEMVYFPMAGNLVARYAKAVSHVLAALAAAALLLLIAAGLRRGAMAPLRLLAGCGVVLASSALSLLAILGLWRLVLLIAPGYYAMTMGEPYNAGSYRIAFTALCAAVALFIHRVAVRRLGLLNYFAAALVVWAILLAAAQVFLPGAGFVFLWGIVFTLPVMGLLLRREGSAPSSLATALILLLSLPPLLMMADLLFSLYEGLGLGLAAPAGLLIALYLALLAPAAEALMRRTGRALPAMTAALGALFIVIGIAGSGFNAAAPRPESLAYGLDADSGGSHWISCNRDPGPFTEQFFREGATRGPLPQFFPMTPRCLMRSWGFLTAPAPKLALEPPRVVAATTPRGPGREVRARIVSPRGARSLVIYLRRGSHIEQVRLCGRTLVDPPAERIKPGHRLAMRGVDFENWLTITYQAVPREGIELTLIVSNGEPVEMRVMDISEGLPDLTRMGYGERPADSLQAPEFLLRESVMASRRVLL
ncbi:MAG: M20/M25/M40 family metallo-hydrolase [Spirochaetes bacterium]|nr:M20/M25/M40 family metallo-hydrolase [Spirochaetota bacterium]